MKHMKSMKLFFGEVLVFFDVHILATNSFVVHFFGILQHKLICAAFIEHKVGISRSSRWTLSNRKC